MAQYPQGIFQSLDWLLKKVKILALAKQPVYTVGTIATGTTYTMVGRGIYTSVVSQSSTGLIQFPNPALCKGQTIVLIGTNSVYISATYRPTVSAAALGNTPGAGVWTFYSDGSSWTGFGG